MPLEGDPFALAKVIRKGTNVHEDSDDVGNYIVGQVEKTLNQPGKGRLYTTNFFTGPDGKVHPIGTRTPHRASAPFDPPAPDTYELLNSFDHKSRRLPNGSEVEVGTGLKQAPMLEYGTSKMLARPFLRPTMLRIWRTLSKPWADGIERRERAEARRLGGRG